MTGSSAWASRRSPVVRDVVPARPRHSRPGPSAVQGDRPPRWRRRWRTRRALAITGVLAALGLAGGPAFGNFTAGGSGVGAASMTTLQPLAVSSAVPATSLLPGTTADLTLTVSNPNSTAVTVTGVSEAGGVSVTGGSGCTGDPSWPGTLGTSGVSALTQAGLSIAVSGGATVTIHLAGASMTTASAAGCQGASFQIPVAVAVRQ